MTMSQLLSHLHGDTEDRQLKKVQFGSDRVTAGSFHVKSTHKKNNLPLLIVLKLGELVRSPKLFHTKFQLSRSQLSEKRIFLKCFAQRAWAFISSLTKF